MIPVEAQPRATQRTRADPAHVGIEPIGRAAFVLAPLVTVAETPNRRSVIDKSAESFGWWVGAVFLLVVAVPLLIPFAGWGTHWDMALAGGLLMACALIVSLVPTATRHVGAGRLVAHLVARLALVGALVAVIWAVSGPASP